MIKRLLTPPHFENEEDNFRAKFIHLFGLTVFGLLVVSMIPQYIEKTPDNTFVVLLVVSGIMLLSLFLLRRKYLTLSGIIIIVLTWLGITVQAATAEGVRDVIVVSYIAIALLASIIISWRVGSIIILLSIGAVWAIAFMEVNGVITPSPQPPLAFARDLSAIFLLITALIYFSTTSLRDAIRRANQSEQELAASNRILQDLNQTLEDRVTHRTQELEQANQRNERRAKQFEAIAQVARSTISNQNLETLLPPLTEVISDLFSVYHTGIFLLEDHREYAVLTASNSTGGKRMLQRGHKLPVGQVGIVGVVAATGSPRIALDVGIDAAYFDNPDLPNTRSELALPLRAGNEVIGVLDVQSTQQNAFQPEDVEVLSTLADQVSIAIQNARSFEVTQQLLEQAEKASGSYLRESWKVLQAQNTNLGYVVSGTSLKPLNKVLASPQIEQAVACKETVVENGNKPTLAVPIRLRNDVVGIMDIHMPSEHEWDIDEVDIANAVAERLSLAIETSLLIESTQRRAEIERITSDISGKISSTTQFDAILRTAAEELSRALGGSEVFVQLQPDALEINPQAAQHPVKE